MKNTTKLLITTSLLISSMAHANEPADKTSSVQVNLGGVYTNFNDFSGAGIKASAKLTFPRTDTFNFYGKVSTQQSHDKKQGTDYYLDENELALGLEYSINSNHSIFLEGADIKQTFDQSDKSVWKDYFSVVRLGTQLQQENYNVEFALEKRDGRNSDFGYSTSIAFFDNTLRMSYTDVGEYESIGFSFQTKF